MAMGRWAVGGLLCLAACSNVWGFRDITATDGGEDSTVGDAATGSSSSGGSNTDSSSGGSDGTSSGSSSGSSSDGGDAGSTPGEAGVPPDAQVDAANIADAQPAAADAPTDSGSCGDDLSSINNGNFHISFDLVATSTQGDGPLVEQRATCGQYDPHWLVAIASGHLVTQTYDGSAGATLQSVATVNDGGRHHVVVAHVAGTMSVSIDGVLDNSIPNWTFYPGTLALLQVGRSACASPYSGQVTNACVTRQ